MWTGKSTGDTRSSLLYSECPAHVRSSSGYVVGKWGQLVLVPGQDTESPAKRAVLTAKRAVIARKFELETLSRQDYNTFFAWHGHHHPHHLQPSFFTKAQAFNSIAISHASSEEVIGGLLARKTFMADLIRDVLSYIPASSRQKVVDASSKMMNAVAAINAVNATALLTLFSTISPAIRSVNVTIHQPGVAIAPSPLPAPNPSSHSEEIIRQFVQLDRTTKWALVEKIAFEGDTYEPEGIVRLGDGERYFVASFQRIYPLPGDNSPNPHYEGFAHLLIFDSQGSRVASATLTESGAAEHHAGGIDYDGTHIWATLGQNKPGPNSTATLVRIDPETLHVEPMLRAADHLGAAVHDVETGNVLTLNWGARKAYVWNLRYKAAPQPAFTQPRALVANPSHWVDYQDCKFLGHSQRFGFRPVMICSGITKLYGTVIGGVSLVDMESMVPLYEVPLTMRSDQGALVTKNPMDVAIVDGKLRLFFLPDERNSTLYAFEAA